MTAPVHYPSPADRYVMMPLADGKTHLTDGDIEGARAFAERGGLRLIKPLGAQDREDGGRDMVFLAIEAGQYEESIYGVCETVAPTSP